MGFIISCTQKSQDNIDFPQDVVPPFTDSWAVIIEPYVSYSDEVESSHFAAHGRLGDVERIIAKKIIKKQNKTIMWFHFEKGWLAEQNVHMYDNRLKAEAASNQLK